MEYEVAPMKWTTKETMEQMVTRKGTHVLHTFGNEHHIYSSICKERVQPWMNFNAYKTGWQPMQSRICRKVSKTNLEAKNSLSLVSCQSPILCARLAWTGGLQENNCTEVELDWNHYSNDLEMDPRNRHTWKWWFSPTTPHNHWDTTLPMVLMKRLGGH